MCFDPMSNDVYPIRNKAFKQDTPIQDCPVCGRKDAIAGIWNDDSEEYFVPRQCNKCRNQQPARPSIARQSATTPTAASRPTSQRTATCKDCHRSFPTAQLKYGRCPACTTKANTLDPNRLCADCRQPFITHDHIAWFAAKYLDIPMSHSAIKQVCPPAGRPTPSPTVKSRSQSQLGFWTRLWKWFTGN